MNRRPVEESRIVDLFVDECVYAVTTTRLRSWGHEVVTAQEAGLADAGDEQILAEAVSQGRILISNNLDFL
jgi:predicted nuclease of predicted toxin-antitoxin system